MRWQLFAAGSCRHLEAAAVRRGAWRHAVFPALFAAVETPDGWLVIDTGYAPRVLELCRTGWWRLYPWLLPVDISSGRAAAAQLKTVEIAGVFLTHFHADHTGGLRDFPGVPVYAGRDAWEAVRNLGGLASLRAAHLPELLPGDFAKRVRLIDCGLIKPPEWVPEGWSHGADVLGDGTLWAVPLPGHAAGQLGILFRDEAGKIVFLVADAMWRADWLLEHHGPRWPVRFITHNWRAYQQTLTRLRRLSAARPDIRMVPFHCATTAREFGVEGDWL